MTQFLSQSNGGMSALDLGEDVCVLRVGCLEGGVCLAGQQGGGGVREVGLRRDRRRRDDGRGGGGGDLPDDDVALLSSPPLLRRRILLLGALRVLLGVTCTAMTGR